jgi:membrane protease YdiL (CAAX protease family)
MRGAGPNGPIGEDAAALLPQTGAEFCPFLVMSVVLGAGWELLYRGYLLWWLEPRVGMAGAILVAAAAYGVGHGFTNIRQFAGSLLAALVFTVAYAATQSLWWLMLIHVGLPLLAAAAQARKLTRESTADALST